MSVHDTGRSNRGAGPDAAPNGRAHHRPGGGFRNPWPTANGDRQPSVLRWWAERLRQEIPPDPPPEQLARTEPRIVHPRAAADELHATWIGHASFLVQIGGRNLLLDPHFSDRASPFRRLGPRRLTPPGVRLDQLPPIDAVAISHNHYDHLDDASVHALIDRFGDRITWLVPLRNGDWLRRRGAGSVVELDWWESASTDGMRFTLLPAQHWSSRSPFDRFDRLWGSWAIRSAAGRAVYFGGDSGYFPGYAGIGRFAGPFDLLLMPIGAYEPRWFMKAAHMNPEEAVEAYREMGARGVLGAMHWGTFRLTDEDPLEPPQRLRQAWARAGLASELLWVPAHGESREIPPGVRLERANPG